MSDLNRYRPEVNGRKEPCMVKDDSGDWTTLSCYYILHDRATRAETEVKRLAAENEQMKKEIEELKNSELFLIYNPNKKNHERRWGKPLL